jgi:hypothetical protein
VNIDKFQVGYRRTTIDKADPWVEAAEEEPEQYGYLVELTDHSGKVAERLPAIDTFEAGEGIGTRTGR